MSEEIRKIVKMLRDKQISEDEAIRLLEAATKTAAPEVRTSEEGGAEEGNERERAVQTVKSAKDYLGLPDSVWRAALLVGIAALFLVLLSLPMPIQIVANWAPALLGIPILVLVLAFLLIGLAKLVGYSPPSQSDLPERLVRLVGIFLLLLALLVLIRSAGFSASFWPTFNAFGEVHSMSWAGIGFLVLFLVLPALVLFAVARPKAVGTQLNWPGFFWRLALLIGIPIIVLILLVVAMNVLAIGGPPLRLLR